MNRFILILHEIIVVLHTQKMKITYRELREKLSDMAKNVPKSQKSTERNKMLLKIHDKMSLNKQS